MSGRSARALGLGALGVFCALPALAQTPPAPPPAAGRRLFGSDTDPPPGEPLHGEAVVMRLSYTEGPGVESCPGEQFFRDSVSAQVHRWTPFAVNAPWRLTVVVTRTPRGFEGTAELRNVADAVEWRRAFPSTPTCVDLVGDLARAIGVHVDPAPGPPRSPALPGAPPEPPTVTPPPLPPPPSIPPEPVKLRVGVLGWMDLATAPRPAFAASVDVGLRVAWFSATVEGRWDPPAGATVRPGVSLTSSRYAGALVPCGHYGWFAGCLVGEVGQLRGSIEAPAGSTPNVETTLLYAGGARLALEIPAVPSRLFVRVAADLLGAPPVVFRLATTPEWSTASFTGGLGAGLVADFW